jgi:hypothetical protein
MEWGLLQVTERCCLFAMLDGPFKVVLGDWLACEMFPLYCCRDLSIRRLTLGLTLTRAGTSFGVSKR